MARTHARVLTSIWQDEQFVALSPSAQRAYLMLLSQPDISHCGVLAFRPRRWARLAAGNDVESMYGALEELHDHDMVVIDLEAEELWVHSFVKYDGILASPNMVKAMWSAFGQVLSEPIRKGFREYVGALTEPISEPFEEPIPPNRGVGVGVGESLPTVGEDPPGGENAPDEEVTNADRLVAGYVTDYRKTHRNTDPPRALRAAAGKAAKALLAEGEDPDVIARCLGVCAKENKHPSNLALIVGDYHSAAS